MRPSARVAVLAIACAVAHIATACGGGGARVAFHATDATFRGAPGPAPRAYLAADVDAVPRVKMRSVGLIEVQVPKGGGSGRAVEVAVEKGRELGCWILVEHSIFATVQSRASLAFGARIYLVHGEAPHIRTSRPEWRKTEFDCVVRDETLRTLREHRKQSVDDVAPARPARRALAVTARVTGLRRAVPRRR